MNPQRKLISSISCKEIFFKLKVLKCRVLAKEKKTPDIDVISIPYYLEHSSVIHEQSLINSSFIYRPNGLTSFSFTGEKMVDETLRVSPNFPYYFNRLFPLELQSYVAKQQFNILSEKFKEERRALEDRGLVDVAKEGKKYFETNRNFQQLVPPYYRRTLAPRISATGNTFHGMKKNLLINILLELSKIKPVSFIDCDMSAAHSRVAKFLLENPDSIMGLSLKDENFWQSQIQSLRYIYHDRGFRVPDNIIKKVLKVGLYTSMNGGNPIGEDRLFDNLTNNAEGYFSSIGLKKENLVGSEFYQCSKILLQSFSLIEEVKRLNESCAFKDEVTGEIKVYTVDRTDPYVIDSKHKGISRVLQGFEVVLLSVLLYDVVRLKLLPISLDHDGILLMANANVDPEELCSQLSSPDSNLSKWSKFLLGEEVPIEPKRFILNGKHKEFS